MWMIDSWVKRPACAMDMSSFQRLGAEDLRGHDYDDDGTGSCKTTVGTS